MNKIYQYSLFALFGVVVVGSILVYRIYLRPMDQNQEWAQTLVSTITTTISSTTTAVSATSTVPTIDEEKSKAVFTAVPRTPYTSNIVGYFSSGAFLINVPEWIPTQWKLGPATFSSTSPNLETFVISPVESFPRDFSDIVMYIRPTNEVNNANSLYENNKKSFLSKDPVVTTEIMLNTNEDMRIYHIQRASETEFLDTFFIDGNGKTAEITFSASKQNYFKYIPYIKEFLQGLEKGTSQG